MHQKHKAWSYILVTPAANLAVPLAEVLRAEAIFIGVNQLDSSGYPDCRPEFIEAFRSLSRVATRQTVEGNPIEIRAPLIAMS